MSSEMERECNHVITSIFSPRLTDPEREAVLKGLIFALDNLELVWPRDTAEQRNTL